MDKMKRIEKDIQEIKERLNILFWISILINIGIIFTAVGITVAASVIVVRL